MGIKLWLIPQISEHWPKNNPNTGKDIFTIFKIPFIASNLTNKLKITQEWITSNEVTQKLILRLCGTMQRLSTSNKRESLKKKSSIFFK